MKKIFTLFIILLPGLVKAQKPANSTAQQDLMPAVYFQNQFLANPALAGVDTGVTVNVAYRKQWTDVQNGPVTGILSSEFYMNKKMGAGLVIYNDQAGIINHTRVGASYAYHASFNEENNEALHLGITVAVDNQNIKRSKVVGEWDDPSIDRFNRRDNYFEADFGMAYTNKGLTIQAALPNLAGTFRNKTAEDGINMTMCYVATSYKFSTKSDQVGSFEPKIALRGVRGYKSIVDVGANMTFAKNFASLFAMYHTSNAFTAGVGFHIRNTVELQMSYTSQTGGVKTNVDGNFGLNMKIRLFK